MVRVGFLLGLLLALAAGPSAIAEEVSAEGASAAVRLEALVRDLRSEEARARLIEQIEAMAAAKRAQDPPAREGGVDRVLRIASQHVGRAGADFAESVAFIFDAEALRGWLDVDGRLSGGAESGWAVVWRILAVLGLGLAVEWAARRLLARTFGPEGDGEGSDEAGTVLSAPMGILFGTIGLAALAVAVAGVAAATRLPPEGHAFVLAFAGAYGAARFAALLADGLLRPGVRPMLALALSREDMDRIRLWVGRFAWSIAGGWLLTETLLLLGMPAAPHRMVVGLVGLFLLGLAVALLFELRPFVTGLLRGNAPANSLRGSVCRIWHVVAIIYLIAVYLVWALRFEGGFAFVTGATAATLAIALAAKFADLAVVRALSSLLRPGAWTRLPGLEARGRRYAAVLQVAFRAIVGTLAAVAVLDAWGAGTFGLLASPEGLHVVGALVRIMIVTGIFVAAWETLSLVIERYLEARDGEGNALDRGSRARTLLPLLRRAAGLALAAIALLTVVSELGVDIAPLLAGIGIFGLAVGFGAQTLVKDIITGLFIIMENQIAVGEYITVAGHSGVVEDISVRTVTLRDLEGTVHVVPFGEIGTVQNLTRDFAYALIDAGVGYGEDTDRVVEVLRGVGAELQADEEWAPYLQPPLEVLGVQELADSAVIIRCRFRTLPMWQWAVAREFRRRMKRRFDEAGIEIPFPQRTLHLARPGGGEAVSRLRDVD